MKIVDNYYLFLTNWLSNWHRAEIIDPISKIRYSTTEQAYMYMKAAFFQDWDSMRALQVTPMEPREAKDLGRKVKNYDDRLWSTVRYGFMVYVNYLKYSQHPDLRQQLIDTKDLILVECNPRDPIWGIGLGENDPRAETPSLWKGRNLLGQVLMEVRDMVKN